MNQCAMIHGKSPCEGVCLQSQPKARVFSKHSLTFAGKLLIQMLRWNDYLLSLICSTLLQYE